MAAGRDRRRRHRSRRGSRVEITESALLADQPAVAARLARLREAGVSIAVDDFGTGYASLAYLTTLPLDTIKIDRGLIADIVGGERDRIVVKAMIRLARELGLKVVVEGVESTAQLALLAEWGCDLYQGFLGAGALDEEELSAFRRRLERARGGLGRLQLLRFLARRRDPRQPARKLQRAVQPRLGVGQSRLTPACCRAGAWPRPSAVRHSRAGRRGRGSRFGEGHHRALGADVELGDHRLAGN